MISENGSTASFEKTKHTRNGSETQIRFTVSRTVVQISISAVRGLRDVAHGDCIRRYSSIPRIRYNRSGRMHFSSKSGSSAEQNTGKSILIACRYRWVIARGVPPYHVLLVGASRGDTLCCISAGFARHHVHHLRRSRTPSRYFPVHVVVRRST